MSGIDEEDVTLPSLGFVQSGFSMVSRSSAWSLTCSAKFFWAAQGSRGPLPLQSQAFEELAYLGRLRRMPVKLSMRSQASAIVPTGVFSNDARMMSQAFRK